MKPPGPLIASGRDADIFEYGPALVLRRSRQARSMAAEADTMEYVRAQGYPVPRIDEVSDDGTELVMERIIGPSMVDAIARRPWLLRAQARALAELHHRLHDLTAPDWLAEAPGAAGSVLLHLDLHPLNVIMSGKGPIVIDWSNAAPGQGATDVALTWVLLAAGGIPKGRVLAKLLGAGRSLLVAEFLRSFDRAELRRHLPGAVEWKLRDSNMTAPEREAMTDLARREGAMLAP